jgi:deoxyribodipyrimidine photolyase-related protein
VLGDQLLAQHPAIAAAEREVGRDGFTVVMVETARKRAARPYHVQKLVLVLSAMRHYAERLRALGYHVDYRAAPTFTAGLHAHTAEHAPARILAMAAADYGPRRVQETAWAAALGVPVVVMPNTAFLVGRHNPYPKAGPDEKVVMEYFYREMRRHFGVLMDGRNAPAGGEWNYDRLNREPLPRGHRPPQVVQSTPDALTAEVMRTIAAEQAAGLLVAEGTLDGFAWAVTHEEAQALADQFMRERLPLFGRYEDAMHTESVFLYHSVLSAYLNLGLLEPLPLIEAAEREYREGRAPLNAVEGFVRQLIGWREFMYWQYWRQMPGLAHENAWDAHRPMPAFLWDGDTRMNCLAHVVGHVNAHAYTHHIERLMLVSNFAVLASLSPTEVVDWFMRFYIDAYDWVMQPNTVGMGLNADGGKTATKPYIASAHYIDRMSDYCAGCWFDKRARTGERACPFNFLYWNFLIEHEARLRANPRFGKNVLGLRHLDDAERAAVRAQAAEFLAGLRPYSDAG